MDPALITALGAVLISLVTAYIQWKKFRVTEEPIAQVNYANVVTDVNSKNLISMRQEMTRDREEYKAELDDVRKDVKAAREETAQARTETALVREENKLLREKLDELEDVREWAERLAHQVVSLGGTPVKMRERKATK